MIDFNKYVDYIYCLNYLPNGRTESLENKLLNVGIDPSNNKFIYFFNDVEHIICSNEEQQLIYRTKSFFAYNLFTKIQIFDQETKYEIIVGYNTYKVLKMAQYMGYERIMIFEDDIVFHKDHNFIIENLEIINNLDFDYCMLQTIFLNCWFGDKKCLLENGCSIESDNIFRINKYTDLGLYGGGAIILTKHGINKIIDFFETNNITVCIDALANKNSYNNFDIIFTPEPLIIQDKFFTSELNKIPMLNKNLNIDNYES